MTCDSSGPATLAISVGLQLNKILMHLKRVLKFEASVRKTPWI